MAAVSQSACDVVSSSAMGVDATAGFMREARTYPEGAVATPHYLATNAGLVMLAAGGNALDAAIGRRTSCSAWSCRTLRLRR